MSADSYEKYNEIHGTLYLPEPKLGVGNQNATPEYLAEIEKIREHNHQERELEERQKKIDQQHEYFYSCSNEPYCTLEVMYYVNYLLKKAKNRKELENDIVAIVKAQNPIIESEKWNTQQMTRKFNDAQDYPTPSIEFKIHSTPEQPIQSQINPRPQPVQPELKNTKPDDYDFSSP